MVQNSSRTTLPLMEVLEKVSPLVALALKRGAGSFGLVVAKRADDPQTASARNIQDRKLRTRVGRGAGMARIYDNQILR